MEEIDEELPLALDFGEDLLAHGEPSGEEELETAEEDEDEIDNDGAGDNTELEVAGPEFSAPALGESDDQAPKAASSPHEAEY